MRYFLELAYKGTDYHGWQIQPEAISVQEVFNHSIATLLNDPTIKTTGCGRTDAGFHASQFYLHFDTEASIPDNFVYRLNKFLPKAIFVYQLIKVNDQAHSRYDAHYRSYDYFLHRRKNPFIDSTSSFHPPYQLNFDKIAKAFYALKNYQDFSPFEKVNNDSKTSICLIQHLEFRLSEDHERICFHIAANRFLRGMVRRIVGCMLDIGREKISLEEFHSVLESQGNFKLNTSAPPQGLYLREVRYPYLDDIDRSNEVAGDFQIVGE